MKNKLILLLCTMLMTAGVMAQTTVSGTVTEANGDPLIGASVVLDGTTEGIITDVSGKFSFSTDKTPPFKLKVGFIGYGDKIVNFDGSELTVKLLTESLSLNQVVVTASKTDESILEAPVTIEKLNLADLRMSPSFDAHSEIANLKGVQTSTGSLTFTTVNTRGFADMSNWRFVTLLDGMDASAPGLNYTLGGTSGPADIDLASIELVPGANSALYGANAFNGILSLVTKDPFLYQGLSAYVKAGVTSQKAAGTNALYDFGLRYAANISENLAFKVNFGYLKAHDWEANDDSYYINIARSASPETYLAIPRNSPNFDAVNVYGDEVQATVDLDNDGTPETKINRTGIKERHIIDYNVDNIKFDASLHYKFGKDWQASYGYRFLSGDAVLRHTTMYPLVNFKQTFHRLEVGNKSFNLKAYKSQENANESYAMLATGGFIEQGRMSNDAWATKYAESYNTLNPNNHDAARTFADSFMPGVDSKEFAALREATLSNPDIKSGGSKFIDVTSMTNIEASYDFKELTDVVDVQIGASYRNYHLDSEGKLFNDGPLSGFGGPIDVSMGGAYIQLGKRFGGLNLRGSLRYDDHQDFDGKLTPRISAVYSFGENKEHNFRASYQTGFRNPGSQEAYIGLDIGAAVLLGGISDNISNYNYERPDGVVVNGDDLNLVTLGSYVAFLTGGGVDPGLFVPANVAPLKQEQNTTFEIGYKGLIAEKLFIDLNYYKTAYQDLIVRVTTIGLAAGKPFLVYTNIKDEVTSNGFGLGLTYLINGGYKIGGNYTLTKFDDKVALENNPGFLPSFNTPENRFNLSLSNASVSGSDFGFALKFRHSDSFVWQSPFGASELDGSDVIDLALTYKLSNLSSMLKLGASNLGGKEYRTVYGGPNVGSIYYVSWTFDQMFSK